MTDLTLTGLRVVLEVARTGSFSATAERLGYTQSAVSRQVAVTEKAVGTPLFERGLVPPLQTREPAGTGTGTPSSGYPHRSLAPIPVRHASVDPATQRPSATQGDTRRDRDETPR